MTRSKTHFDLSNRDIKLFVFIGNGLFRFNFSLSKLLFIFLLKNFGISSTTVKKGIIDGNNNEYSFGIDI